jgi:hypothetical protein
MASVKITKECVVEAADEVGALAKVLGAAAAGGIDIQAVCGYGMEGKGHVMVLSDRCEDACTAFKKAGLSCGWNEVVAVTVPDQVGAGAKLAKKLADAGINIEYVYGSNAGGANCLLVFSTSDNAKAAGVLK